MSNLRRPIRAKRTTPTRQTTVEIADAKLADETLIRAARLRSIERLRTMDGLDLDKAKVMAGAWRR